MAREEKTQPRVVVIFVSLLVTAIALLIYGTNRELPPKVPAGAVTDAGVAVTTTPNTFPPLLAGLEPDGGALLDTTVRSVDWREGDSIVLRFERLEAPPTTLEVRLFDTNAPPPLAHSNKLAVYVMSPPDSGTALRDETLARALGEFLATAEREGRPIPQLLPLQ